jgi:predicted DNA-binding transcriptional regulator AlpA
MPKFLKYADLESVGITYSPLYLKQLEQQGKFPKRIKLGNSPVWAESEIQAFLESKLAAARGA